MGDAQPQITAEGVPLPNTSLPPYVKGLLKFPINYQEFLEEDVLQCGLRIKELEDNIQWFENDKSKTMKELNKLQDPHSIFV
ncbi:hypothetical protein M9H77_24297 [Catharanthus roseus]|uniref:Uncharacterized protein n=1 Tax=Catharanthus roseus TaxID=4058 RepID=A0ACC0AVQ3_CATRO|nr:hypothetical protein M9H77_24297 [Catharanthus roseus]